MEEEAMVTTPDSETDHESSAPKQYKQMPSVYTATGMVVDPAAQLHHLPSRHKKSITPRLRWFLELSLAGIGKYFVLVMSDLFLPSMRFIFSVH